MTDKRGISAATTEWLAHAETKSDNDDDVLRDRMLAALIGDTACVVTTAKVFKALADQCQNATTRRHLTEHSPNLSQALCGVLQRTLVDLSRLSSSSAAERADHVILLVQALRCMGNVSADNDAARGQLLAHGGVGSIAAVLGVAEVRTEPLLARAAFGAALNVALDHAECRRALLAGGALQAHLQVLGRGTPCGEWGLVCMSLDSLCEHDDASAHFAKHADYMASVLRTLGVLSRQASGAEEEQGSLVRGAMRTLVWVLCEAVEKSADVRRQLCTPTAVLAVFDLLDFYLTAPKEEKEEESDDDDDVAPPAPLPNRPIPQPAGNRYADAVTQAIVAVSGEDQALATLFPSQPLMNRLVSVLTAQRLAGAGESRADGMAAAAALCLGNLARTDEHCTRLVAEHAALVRMVIHEWLIPRSVNVRTRHAASGLLKNLCLPVANRAPLAAMGVVAAAAANVKSAVVPIQANCIGILRHLANGSPDPATVLDIVVHGALSDALAVVKETDVDAIRCEGTRLIATVAKRVYLATADNHEARDVIDKEGYDLVTPLVRLVMLDGVRHPLLRQESLVALTVLATTAGSARHARDILRMLLPENSVPLAKPPTTTNPVAEVVEEEETSGGGFADILADLIANDGGPLPQAALQAKSLITQLANYATAATESDTTVEGISILNTMLLPLIN
ncbi:Rap1 GTPase-GDP dissociation stimulator 1 [Coemansia sp. 'formosensis']|nr:Rap1 GTPase-GDP dissociation stimulator 1 [Coemansia sp. 'formosensis']